jgi:Sulfotransferase family
MPVRPIFVVGSPRSGTTMIGNYLGSARSVLNAGEYRALYLAYGALPIQLGAAHRLEGLAPPEWEPFRAQYIEEVQRHAAEFIVRIAEREGFSAFCDSFPRNVLIGSKLAEIFPDALFVLTLRHYTGTIQSLLRLGTIRLLPAFEAAIDWVDPTAVAAAVLWSRHYQASFNLPNDRTIVFGYDRFCADPEPVLRRFKAELAAARFPVEELDDSRFAQSHATEPGKPRPTAGRKSGGRIRLAATPSFDATTWTPVNEQEVREAVMPIDDLLRSIFPDDYADPVGYRGSEALIAEAPASIEPSLQAAEAESRATPPASRRRVTAPPQAPVRQRAPRQIRGSDKPARARRATGR